MDHHARDFARMFQLAVDRAEKKLKVEMDEDMTKIESLEAELTRLRKVSRVIEDAANQAKTDLAMSESLR